MLNELYQRISAICGICKGLNLNDFRLLNVEYYIHHDYKKNALADIFYGAKWRIL